MYLVPMELPKHCNKCPFGMCHYQLSLQRDSRIESDFDRIDRKEDRAGTYGYVCNVEFQKNGRYTKVMRSDIGFDIEKPDWCELKEV